jgi:hypothetical protein
MAGKTFGHERELQEAATLTARLFFEADGEPAVLGELRFERRRVGRIQPGPHRFRRRGVVQPPREGVCEHLLLGIECPPHGCSFAISRPGSL